MTDVTPLPVEFDRVMRNADGEAPVLADKLV